MKFFIVGLSLSAVLSHNSYAQDNNDAVQSEQAKTQEILNENRMSNAKDERKATKVKARAARTVEADASDAAKESRIALREEKRAQKARKRADKQARKAEKARDKSDQH